MLPSIAQARGEDRSAEDLLPRTDAEHEADRARARAARCISAHGSRIRPAWTLKLIGAREAAVLTRAGHGSEHELDVERPGAGASGRRLPLDVCGPGAAFDGTLGRWARSATGTRSAHPASVGGGVVSGGAGEPAARRRQRPRRAELTPTSACRSRAPFALPDLRRGASVATTAGGRPSTWRSGTSAHVAWVDIGHVPAGRGQSVQAVQSRRAGARSGSGMPASAPGMRARYTRPRVDGGRAAIALLNG